MRPKLLLAAMLVASTVGAQSLAPRKAAAKPTAPVRQRGAAKAVTPLAGICDGSAALDVLGDLGDRDAERKRNQIALLQGRIIECSRKIDEALVHLPTPSPSPYWVAAGPLAAATPTPTPVCQNPPAATLTSNRFALYERLERCAAYWTYLSTPPTPEPTETPLPSVASRPTFYVFATGAADQTAAAVLIRSVVGRLIEAQRRADSDVAVAGRADWTTPDSFASQCQLDSNTRGALVIETSIPETSHHNYLLLVANFTNVSASVEMLGCGEEDHNPGVSPLSLYTQQAVTGKAHQDALALGIFSAIVPFLVSDKSKTTVTTAPKSMTITKTDSTAPVLSGSLLGFYESQNLTLPAQNASVGLTVASERFADSTMERLTKLCSDPDIVGLANQAGRPHGPPAPPEHRTIIYKAASEYISDCSSFANFDARSDVTRPPSSHTF
ncbi:MAG: hypothetical protein GIX03_08370 [Candidatus Eremiobacteraeota bacterium]|nr:hypothetical protein [Candidatus Eremiobacteraeota bacterium]MBC5802999.1 hypothetical protein [Candidatus Eremiobacteraeota bacterium]MBC5823173.1 hypothetical protein [Candidatus Eremiobacteraeota bacterium]